MLAEIRIEALGAISAATAEFGRGLTVLTGETGFRIPDRRRLEAIPPGD